ncbi:MAG: hypothetical protein H6585_08025 [Flavobacteriales bacterium]|nr:hypothetical protein [Flavobacteriales bacterium]MCB9448275.1 hypothetical protein [Flavobacteriales bacterium]
MSRAQTPAYEQNQTLSYDEVITAYQKLAENNPMAFLFTYGTTDAGKPLHMLLISKDGDVDPVSLRKRDKRIILINNGIHPGEPCGVDASLQFATDLLARKLPQLYLDNTVICIIPAYNIGGMMNRNSVTRVNQNGPETYGFRGNAKDLDLNRDFIKCDSRNARAFAEIYHTWRPDIFIDTHTSDGADYSYSMTLIATQPNKINPLIGQYMKDNMLPALYKGMADDGYEMTPYVDMKGDTPDNGLVAFLETPRYSTGYTALFHTIGFITEAHMLKPYPVRVKATYHFLTNVLKYSYENCEYLGKIRGIALQDGRTQKDFGLRWELDTTQTETITFKGYTAAYKPSEVTGKDRLYYDRNQPYEKQIPYYNKYKVTAKVTAPVAYIIPQAWREVIELLKMNKIMMHRVTKDTVMQLSAYHIDGYETVHHPYEGHYLHYDIKVSKDAQPIQLRKDDMVVYVNQTKNRFIVETLEPNAPDSYFAWNFFDNVLMQKEWFSPYLFEDEAAEMLKNDPALKQQFDLKKIEDDSFAENPREQLYWVYAHSVHYEKEHNRYPVFRLDRDVPMPVKLD